MGDRYDIFFSYAHADKEAVKPLLASFAAKAINVFHDETEIIDGQSISRRITDGLSSAKILVAWYSKTYPTRRACQWELTAAIIAAQRDSSDIKAIENRVLALNPESTRTHIQPLHIQDQRYIAAYEVDAEKLAQQVFDHLQRIDQTFGEFHHLTRPHWFGSNMRLGSNRFVGRVADLWAIHSGLLKHNFAMITGSGTGLVQVQGMGGIGKTLLAEEYALRFGSAYPGGVFWLRATSDTGEALSTQILHIADHLTLETANLTPDQILGLLRRELSAKDPYLWVVDDIPPDAATEDLVNWRAPSVNGVTLVTTRSTQMEGSGFVHRLDVLSDEEALELLTSRRIPKSEAERADAWEILKLLGNHALAVDVARAAVDKLGYADFLKRLKNSSTDATDFAAKLSGELPTGHEKQIASTLLDSIRRLDENGRNFLHLAALLAPAPIPQELVTDVFSRFSAEPESGADQAILGMDAATREALAERPPCVDDAPDSISVHVLVSRTIRFHAGEPPSALRDAVIAAVTDRMKAAEDIRNHSHLLPLIAHARALTVHPLDVATATILLWLGRFNHERGAFAEAETDCYRTLETTKLLLGLEHPTTLASLNNLAGTLWAQGDHADARAILEMVLAVRRRVQGAEHPDTLTSMNNLAGTLSAQGDHAGARALHEEELVVCCRVQGAEHPDTLTSMNNLAQTLKAQGDHAGAWAIEEEVLAVRRRVLGAEHPDTLTSMNNLAQTLWAQGDHAGARAIQEKVLAVRRRVLGAEHPDTLTSLNNLAGTLWAQGDHADARAIQEKVLAVRRRVLGAEHPDTLTSMNNLAGTLSAQGDHVGARAIQEEVLAVRRRVLGAEHPATLTSMNNLAATLSAQDDYAGARAIEEEVLAVRRRVLGAEHPDTLTSMNNLALTLAKLGEAEAARALIEEALPIAIGKYGREPDFSKVLLDSAAYLGMPFPSAALPQS